MRYLVLQLSRELTIGYDLQHIELFWIGLAKIKIFQYKWKQKIQSKFCCNFLLDVCKTDMKFCM